MSYYAYDSDGYLGQVASVNGWSIMRVALLRAGKASRELVEDGWTDDVEALRKETSTDGLLKPLHSVVRSAVDIVIVTDNPNAGVGE